MAQLSNSFASFNSSSVREELLENIWNVSVKETPTLALVGKTTVKTEHPEWQTDNFEDGVATNKVQQGNTPTITALTDTLRFGNYTQISEKNGAITNTMEAVDKAGFSSKYDYEVAKKMVSLKKDIECSFLQNTTATKSAAGTPGQARGLLGWIYTNTSKGVSGVDPVPLTNTAPTDGTQRAFSETLLKDVMKLMFDNGTPDMDKLYALIPSSQRTIFDGFLSGQTRFDKSEDKTLHAVLEVYIGPFGRVSAVNARHMRQREVFLMNPDYVALGTLKGRGIKETELAKVGDSRQFMVNCEWTSIVRNEKALGAIRDLS